MPVKINTVSQRYLLYPFLIPIFFSLHKYVQYYGLVSIAAATMVLLKIEILVLAAFLLLVLGIKNNNRSALITAILTTFTLFFGDLKDFIQITPGIHFFARYFLFLPIVIILVLLLLRYILWQTNFYKSNGFLNVLLAVFIITEIVSLLYHGTGIYFQHNSLLKDNAVQTQHLPVAKECPDVYYLVFDSYPGSDFLREYLGYDNSGFDSVLINKGFFVVSHPKSNYNRTAFSMASTLNFQYLQNIPDQSNLQPKNYNQASLSIRHAAVINLFERYGYQIQNLSFFDLGDHPSMFKENFLVLPDERMLLYNTFWETVQRDIMWNFYSWLHRNRLPTASEQQEQQVRFIAENSPKKDFNNYLIDSLQKVPFQITHAPKFIYAHFYLPHPPFFYDRNGQPLALDIQGVNLSMEQKDAFLSYLEYTNKVIIKIVSTVLEKSGKNPVIIIQSDHGYRDFRQDFVHPVQYFRNYSAFYFPDKNYSKLYHTMSNINTFPLFFNKYFNMQIPLQKDTSVFTGY